MGHQQHRETVLLPEPFDQLLHFNSGQGIQRPQGLVEQQQARLMNQRTGQRHALLLSTGQRCRPLVGAVGQAHRFQSFKRLRPPVALEAETDVVDDLFPRQQTRFLEHQPRVLPRLIQWRGTGQQFTARGLVETGEQAQQGTFAAATATDHGNKLARRNVQVDLTQHLPRAKGLLQLAHRQRNPAQQAWRLLRDHAAPPLAT